MMKIKNYSLLIRANFLILLTCLSLATQGKSNDFAQNGNDSTRVLFVGNSFIYFYNLPQVVSSLVNSGGEKMIAKKSTIGGSNLEQHWKAERGTQTMKLLAEEEWDYVVFNNHSRSAIETPESFMTYGKKFAELVKKKGATPIFIITWAYESNPSMQLKITEGYLNLAKEAGADFVPAGPLFEQARKLNPDLNLFHDDKHPSATGTYLIALTFYKYFQKGSVKNAVNNPKIKDYLGEQVQLIFIKKQDSDFLKQLVDEFEMPSSK